MPPGGALHVVLGFCCFSPAARVTENQQDMLPTKSNTQAKTTTHVGQFLVTYQAGGFFIKRTPNEALTLNQLSGEAPAECDFGVQESRLTNPESCESRIPVLELGFGIRESRIPTCGAIPSVSQKGNYQGCTKYALRAAI